MAEHGAGRKETIQDKLARLAEAGRACLFWRGWNEEHRVAP